MGQHADPDPDHDEDQENPEPEEVGTLAYQGSGLSVRALTAEELQRLFDTHADQPVELLRSGWATLESPGYAARGPRTSPAPTPPRPTGPVTGSHGSPGRSAVAAYRRRRAEELVVWTRSLAWRAPLVAAAGLVGDGLVAQAGIPGPGWLAWPPQSWLAGGCGSGFRNRLAPGGAAPTGSGTRPASWTGSPATATWCSTTSPCPARSRTSTTW
jgi:hypothetical protein